jgi:hypothetical protein
LSKIIVEDGVGTATIGDYELQMKIDVIEDEEGDESYCINLELLSIEDTWYAKASFNPDTIFELIESLTLIANHFGLERPKQSLFVYNGEAGTC